VADFWRKTRCQIRHRFGGREGSRDRQSETITEREKRIWQTVKQLAQKYGRPLSHIALAWVLRLPIVSSAIIGASNIQQLEENANASGFKLADEDIALLNQQSEG
jgi:aryl-alcohol dehydrogenase-like predicted oxidoreductase